MEEQAKGAAEAPAVIEICGLNKSYGSNKALEDISFSVKKGEIMGLCNGKIKFIGESVTDIAIKSTQKLFKKGEHSLITIIFGEGASEEDAAIVEEALSKKFGNDVEISIVNGNQPIYYFIISVE